MLVSFPSAHLQTLLSPTVLARNRSSEGLAKLNTSSITGFVYIDLFVDCSFFSPSLHHVHVGFILLWGGGGGKIGSWGQAHTIRVLKSVWDGEHLHVHCAKYWRKSWCHLM